MFVSEVLAQDSAPAAADTGAQPSALSSLFPLLLIFLIFYFFIIRPQQNKLKNHVEMVKSIRRGDKVLLGGGIYGTVTKIEDDQHLMVQIAEGVEVKVARDTVANVLHTGAVKEEKK